MSDAARFLNLLDPDAKSWSFRAIHPSRGATSNIVGTFNEQCAKLQALNNSGHGVFVVVNYGGNKGSDITRIRSLFVDFDNADDDHLDRLKAVPFQPSIILESSPGKHHAYWLIEDCPVKDFQSAQKALIALLDADECIHDLPRIMRLPGFWHTKGELFETKLIHEGGDRYQWSDFSAWLQSIQPSKDAAPTPPDRYLDRICGAVAMAAEGQRNATLHQKAVAAFAGAREGKSLSDAATVEQRLTEAAFRAGMDAEEISATIASARNGRIATTAIPAENDEAPPPSAPELPEFAPELVTLPGGLGKIQRYIHAKMIYPSQPTAGMAAIAGAAMIAQQSVGVRAAYDQLGLNEYFVCMAPTTFGKESLRRSIEQLRERMIERNTTFMARMPTEIQYALPASAQGFHDILAGWNSQMFMADEFAEWMVSTKNDGHKQQALGYAMEIYSKAFSSASASYSATNKRQPIKNPRLSIFATTTGERLLESLTGSHADSGAYNRMVLYVAEQDRIPKRYEMPDSENLLDDAADVLKWIHRLPDNTTVTFSPSALEYFKKHDSVIIEPLKFSDGRLAGRLSEQAIKLSAIIALCDQRLVVEEEDLRTAYVIRESLYLRAKRLIDHEGGMSGQSATGAALEQVREVFRRHASLPRSSLCNFSRRYQALAVHERENVIKALIREGAVTDSGKRLLSAIYRQAA